MQVMTYNEALAQLCDNFDELIAPRTIARSNTNVIYLLFKAFAKAWEVINNLCVALGNKFDPMNCTDSELESLAAIVGTERLTGSASGILITVTNNSASDEVLPAGVYSYALDEHTVFSCNIGETLVPAESGVQFVFLSTEVGRFSVTAQSEIKITGVDAEGEEITIPEQFVFSNADNATILGYADETVLEFRKRILEDTNRQDIISELQTQIKNLPFVFDCNIKFNSSDDEIEYDGYTLPPYYMLLMLSGENRSEIAKVVAEKSIYPTLMTDENSYAEYQNEVFANGKYRVYITPYKKQNFSVKVTYYADDNFILPSQAESKIRSGLITSINGNKHTDIITENDIFTLVNNMGLTGVKMLGVQMFSEGSDTPLSYIVFQETRLPFLTTVETESVTLSASPVAVEPTEGDDTGQE